VARDVAKATVRAALDGGITTFDTADVYARTEAERVLGEALVGVRRESIEIFSKVYWPIGPGRNDRGLSRKHIIEGCHGSLKRLGVEYLDVYQAHRYDYATPLAETLRAFDDLVRQGKVLYIGVSEWSAEQIADALRIADQMGFDRLVANQPQYNALWRVIEAEVVPLCEKQGIGQIVWSPIAQGALSGKYLPGQAPPSGSRATSRDASFVQRFLAPEVLSRIQLLRPVAEQVGLTMAQLAIAWVLQNPAVSSAIVGASRPEQLLENVAAAGVRLEPEVMRAIDEALAPVTERDPARTSSPHERP
jgi:aryl-alcohol dehydrogenase-like predicted oxidoreductase